LKTGGEAALAEPKPWRKLSATPNKEDADAAPANGESKPLFERLHCIGCHNSPDGKDEDPKKMPLKQVGEKFAAGKLPEFLRAPERNYEWIRMPNFRLTSAEAKELSEFLLKSANPLKEVPAPEAALIERGKGLVQSAGCLQCHSLKLENKLASPDFAKLAAAAKSDRSKATKRDCLGATPFADYSFTAEEKSALGAFIARGEESLARHVPAEFAARQTRDLNCTGCHGQAEGFPPLEILGGKLKPEWMAQFIGGEVSYKPRAEKHPRGESWLEMRMPAFKSRATLLAEGLSEQQGYPPRSPTEPATNADLAKFGQKLVGKDGGFSCISCHGAGALEATEVFESEGINLAYSAERLLPQYYRRWVRNPLSIDPQTKMPVYFDEGKSPLTDILDGDAEKQIDAVWQYLRLGEKMPLPNTGAQ
jgi:mono/diheme cytochrome c family protein